MTVTRAASARLKHVPVKKGAVVKVNRKQTRKSSVNSVNSKIKNVDKVTYTKHLFKSESESRVVNGHEMKYSIDDLIKEDNATCEWDGVRNYEARNCMKDMKLGDLAFFYHSNTKKSRPAIVAIVQVVKEAYPDFTAWEKANPHFDQRSTKEKPLWFMVDVKFVRKLERPITLDELKADERFNDMPLIRRSRISVQHVPDVHWDLILQMSATKTTD